MFQRFTFSFLGVCVLSLVAQSTAAVRRDSPNVRVLMLGDSLTDGFGLTRSQAFPALVGEKMRGAGYDFEMINAGESGDTTADGLRRLPRFLHHRIDVLVLELGINDAFRGVPVAQMRQNLQQIIDRTRAHSPEVKIVIAGMQLPLQNAEGYVRAFGELFGELAVKNHCALIPYLLVGVGGDPTLNLDDLIHPNAAGQKIVAETVWRVLEPLLRQTTARVSAHVK